jgi:hypothetical protein
VLPIRRTPFSPPWLHNAAFVAEMMKRGHSYLSAFLPNGDNSAPRLVCPGDSNGCCGRVYREVARDYLVLQLGGNTCPEPVMPTRWVQSQAKLVELQEPPPNHMTTTATSGPEVDAYLGCKTVKTKRRKSIEDQSGQCQRLRRSSDLLYESDVCIRTSSLCKHWSWLFG